MTYANGKMRSNILRQSYRAWCKRERKDKVGVDCEYTMLAVLQPGRVRCRLSSQKAPPQGISFPVHGLTPSRPSQRGADPQRRKEGDFQRQTSSSYPVVGRQSRLNINHLRIINQHIIRWTPVAFEDCSTCASSSLSPVYPDSLKNLVRRWSIRRLR